MDIKEFFIMEIDCEGELELAQMRQGITWPALVALNSSFMLENKKFRKALFMFLKKNCNDRGMMPFFVNQSLQKKYPPDLESTALFVSACALNKEEIITDLDGIKKMVMPNGFFKTWLDRAIYPIDYTSQLIMALCYGFVGMNVDQTLERTIEEKFKNITSLRARDVYYTNPLYFIYFTLYISDIGVFPNTYRSLIERFIETFVPADDVEASMIQKICFKLEIANPFNQIIHMTNPLFTNGTRHWIRYYSQAVKEIFRSSATLDRANRFNRSKKV